LGYYQTVWEDFESDTEIWSDYAKRTSPQTIYRLVEQINTLLKCSTEAITHCILMQLALQVDFTLIIRKMPGYG
jgi:hypothetical protein